jgi:LPXTG-motif cell wall-anchored protein
MLSVIAVLLLVWLVLAVLGAMIEGLLWMTIVGAVLFIATAAYGAMKRRRDRQALRLER